MKDNHELATFASPASHVAAGDPPLLILHGDSDSTVKMDQSETMVRKYREAGLDVTLVVIPGAGHGTPMIFSTPTYCKLVADFLGPHLRPISVISDPFCNDTRPEAIQETSCSHIQDRGIMESRDNAYSLQFALFPRVTECTTKPTVRSFTLSPPDTPLKPPVPTT